MNIIVIATSFSNRLKSADNKWLECENIANEINSLNISNDKKITIVSLINIFVNKTKKEGFIKEADNTDYIQLTNYILSLIGK